MQRPQCGAPLVAINQIVPVRDQIVDRAALMAKRDTAIHAARRLLARLGLGQRLDEFVPAAAPDIRFVIGAVAALDLKKACRFTHRLVLGSLPRLTGSM